MRPCDCQSLHEVENKLNEAGLRFNDCSLTVHPLYVVLENGPGRLTMPMRTFQRLCEWYLRDQAVLTDRYERKHYDGVIEVGPDGQERWLQSPDGEGLDESEPLDEEGAAKFLGLAVQTMRNWRHKNVGPAYIKLSKGPRGRIGYLMRDLQAYRASCRVKPEGWP